MSAKHTQGRWTVELDVMEDGSIDIFAEDGRTVPGQHVANVVVRDHPDDDDPPREVALANAHLFAAAPDMRNAIENSLEYLRVSLGSCDPDCECVIHPLEAALAKAEGR